MSSFENYFRARKAASSFEARMAVDMPDVPVTLAYDRIPPCTILESPFGHVFSSDFLPLQLGLEEAAPLTQRLMADRAAAGYDLDAYLYTIAVAKIWAMPAEDIRFHTDGALIYEPEESRLRACVDKLARTERFIVSDIYPTARISPAGILAHCPEGMDPLAYYCAFADYQDDPEEAGKIIIESRQTREGLEEIMVNIRQASAELLIPARAQKPSHIIGIDFNVLHAVTCRFASEHNADALRTRLMLTMEPRPGVRPA